MLGVLVWLGVLSLADTAVTGPFEIFPGGAPFEKGDKEHEHEKDGIISNVSVPTLTIYTPDGLQDPSPAAMLVLPGGGFEHVYIEKEGNDVAKWLNSLNITAGVLKYRCPLGLPRTKIPGLLSNATHTVDFAAEIWRPLQDAQRAIGLMRSHVNASAVGVVGFSAGGSLAAFLATHWRERMYAARDAADSKSCRPDFAIMAYPAPLIPDPDSLRNLLPGLIVDKHTPPSFVAQALDDQFWAENSVAWWVANKRDGNRSHGVDLNVYPSGGHGFGVCNSTSEVCSWTERARRWLEAGNFIASA